MFLVQAIKCKRLKQKCDKLQRQINELKASVTQLEQERLKSALTQEVPVDAPDKNAPSIFWDPEFNAYKNPGNNYRIPEGESKSDAILLGEDSKRYVTPQLIKAVQENYEAAIKERSEQHEKQLLQSTVRVMRR